ncbi:MAG: protein-export chaperone SecB [Gammaproteobacteria bacterium RBG_16_51_14]|nr:MAG: protein-export chaperone SecB [Gammaproteobacteria bacterium RBG_16_51_14]
MAEKSENTKQPLDPESGQFAIQKVYVKDVSFEVPHAPDIFRDEWNPAVNMQISNQARTLEADLYDVVMTVTVTVTFGEKTVYLAEIHQAGIFHISGFPDEVVGRMLGTICPNILFPFAREMVADLVTRGGFPQLLLAPVNFEALYMQQGKQQAKSSDHPPGVTH